MKTILRHFFAVPTLIATVERSGRVSPRRLFVLIGAVLAVATQAGATDLIWIGGAGNWTDAGNWSPAQVPGAADNAFITNSGTYTVTLPAGSSGTVGALTVGGGSGTQTLAIDRATLTLNGAGLIQTNAHLDFLVSQTTLTGAGNLTVNGTLNWINGMMTGTGSTSVGNSGQVVIGNGGVTLGRTLNNSGNVSWSGGNLTLSSGVALNNLAAGRFDITADGRLSGGATTPINNAGLLRQTAGTVGMIVTTPFNNSGTLQVLAAKLSLSLGGVHTGVMSNAPGATLNFAGGPHSLSGGSLVTGAGVLLINGTGTTLAAGGTIETGATLSVTAGTVTLSPGCIVTGARLSVGGGTLNFNTTSSVATMDVTAGTLGGGSPVNVTGPLTLGGGSVTNTLVNANGGLEINGGVTLNGGKLVNSGIAVWSAGNFAGANGAVFSNLLGAAFFNTFDGNAASGAGATPTFYNAGLFAKTNGSAAAGTTSIDFQFINTGRVEVQTNTLRYGLNQQTAGVTVLNGGGLSAQAQPIQLLGGSLVGTGLVTLANVQNLINSSSISPGLPLGELDISGNYQQTAAGTLNIDLGGYAAGTEFDRVTVTAGGAGGVATLGGTLNVTLTNGFSPTNGATFTVLTAINRVGAFSSFTYPSNDIGLQVSYDTTSAKVTVSNLKPVVLNPISDPPAGSYGTAFSFQFPANVFSDPEDSPLTYSASGTPPGLSFVGSTRTFSGIPTQAGVFPVTVSAADGGIPNLTATNLFTITIDPAAITITADARTKVYGATDPVLTFTVTGLKLGDTAATALTGALTRAPGESVTGGPYAITQGTLAPNGNYTMAFIGSALTITKASLLVTADSKSKTYGAADPAVTATYSGFVNGETSTVLGGTLTFSRAPGESVGSYSITPGGLTSGNYALTFNPGTLNITKAGLTVTADARTKVYGATDPALTFTVAGLQLGDTAATALTGALTRAPGESVTGGPYAITQGTMAPNGNYTVAFTGSALTITKAPLSVTADSKSKTYGATDPAFTATYIGFINGETSTVLGGALTFSRAPGESVGSYSITPGGLTSGNYALTFNPGTLNITKAGLTVTADARTKVYGATDPALTFTVAGLQLGDTAATALTGALARAPGESVTGSPYAITQGTLAPNGNYAVVFTGSALTITKAPLSVTADSKSKTYGAADPAFTATYIGFVNGETSTVLGGALTFSRAPGESVGGYSITPGGLTSGNYALTFNSGFLKITAPAPVMLPFTLLGPANVRVNWSAVSNGVYRVQFKEDLNATHWTDLIGDVVASGEVASKADVLTTASKFYRVQVVP